jgi:acyl-CoA synthetase (AMP-forming)/AMP-acid ligase II
MPLIEKIAPLVKSLKKVIVLTDKAHMPQTALPNVVAYEEWIKAPTAISPGSALDEARAAGMCYTSGTTGDPKGVVYSHRSNVLHAMIACMPDAMGISARDAIMPVVPMFHANAWGLGQRSDDRRQDWSCRAARWTARRSMNCWIRKGDFHGRGANRLADAAAASGSQRARSCLSEQGRHRRLGLPAHRHREIRGRTTASRLSTPGA